MNELSRLTALVLCCLALAASLPGCQVKPSGQIDVGAGIYRLQQ